LSLTAHGQVRHVYCYQRTGQFAHVSGILVVTPEGRLSRYFYGVEYSPKELRLALVESGQGRIGSAIDELLLYCFHYDPESGRYGLVVMNLVRLGGVMTVLFMGGFILMMRRRESRPRAPSRGPHRARLRDGVENRA
jgi:protein SCO1/2